MERWTPYDLFYLRTGGTMKIGDLVILNPNSGVIMDMFEDDPDEYEQELK